MGHLTAAVANLFGVAREAWPDSTGYYHALEFSTLSFVRKAYDPPFTVLDLALAGPDPRGRQLDASGRSDEGIATLYRVVSDGQSLTELIFHLETLQHRLHEHQRLRDLPNVQIFGEPTPEWSLTLPLNVIFREAEAPFLAGAVSFIIFTKPE